MSIEVSYLISFLFGTVGLVGSIYGMSRNRKNDIKQNANETTNIAYELKALHTSLTKIEMSIESNGKMTLENHDKILKLETKMETVFTRIDELKGGIR